MTSDSAASGALPVGRTTFEAFRSFWPGQAGPIADHINTVPQYVVSTTMRDPRPAPWTRRRAP